jgi:hypothetical protein
MGESEQKPKLAPPPRLPELYIAAGLLWLWALHSAVGAIQSIAAQAPVGTILLQIGRALLQGFIGYTLLQLSFAAQTLALIFAAVNLLYGAGEVWQHGLTIEMAFPIAYVVTGAALLACLLLPRVRRAFRERRQAIQRYYQERRSHDHPPPEP